MTENPSDSREAQDAAFLERVAAPLRAPEFLDETFEARLMEKIRREGALSHSVPSASGTASWWRTERLVRVSPLKGLAIAAGLAGIIALSTLRDGPAAESGSDFAKGQASAQSVAGTDTVHVVRFVFVDPRASTVEIVGDFNAWTKGVTKLERTAAPGVWSASVALPAGRHEYAFIINGTRWIADPLAPKTSDDFGTESAVIHVGSMHQSAT
jgi:hypothetical protein